MRPGKLLEDKPAPKPVVFIGSSREDLRAFPEAVRRKFGNAIRDAQNGDNAAAATPMMGYKGAGVLEVVEDYETDTYRGVYALRFAGVVYVLHAFQKKSRHGIKTPPQDLALIDARLRDAQYHYEHLFLADRGERYG